MKVFVAGGTGVLGRELVPQLVAARHEVMGMTKSASKQDLLRSLGAHPVVADALDPDAVAEAVASAQPEVIVHQLTALSGPMSVRDALARVPRPARDPLARAAGGAFAA
jgi:nucleoside-diphosphate-sugar epimerase